MPNMPLILRRLRFQMGGKMLQRTRVGAKQSNSPRGRPGWLSGLHRAASVKQEALPLSDVKVVSLEQAIAGPYCTRHLADLGARVIKVERPGMGDFAREYDRRVNGLSSHFVWCNRSKESLTLDLKDNKDIENLKDLLLDADVFVQNLAPGACARLGLSYELLSKSNPRLIVCDISGYGSNGPYRNKKAYDLMIQSEAGLLSVTGTKTEPVKAGISIADIAAGMYAYCNILAALIQRKKTAKGKQIDISMLESMVEWMGFPLYYAYNGAPGPKPEGAAHSTIYPYGPFEAGDGQAVMLGLQNEREWVRLCAEVLSNDSLIEDARFSSNSLRMQNRHELHRIVCESFSNSTAEQVVSRLDKSGIANAKVNDMAAVWAHPQLAARQRWTTIETSNGVVPALLPPGVSSLPAGVTLGAVPAVGEHNKPILEGLKGKTRAMAFNYLLEE